MLQYPSIRSWRKPEVFKDEAEMAGQPLDGEESTD